MDEVDLWGVNVVDYYYNGFILWVEWVKFDKLIKN